MPCRGALATDVVRARLGDFLFCPGYDQRAAIEACRVEPSDVPESDLTCRNRSPALALDSAPPDWLEHLDCLAARAAAGVPIASGYRGARDLAGLDAD
ncbi:MAG TPA: hypothetical protein P5534_21810 [Candidatus Paceibacterota bacterium]|nr:hypothetical protein [Candidatus Paceibacterota bacterium]